MKGRAALLLLPLAVTLAFGTPTTVQSETTTRIPDTPAPSTSVHHKKFDAPVTETIAEERTEIRTTSRPTTTTLDQVFPKVSEILQPFANPKDLLLQEFRSLDEDASTNRIQEELARAIKAKAHESKDEPRKPSISKARSKIASSTPVANGLDESFDAEFDKDEAAALRAMKQDEIVADEDSSEEDDDDDEDDDGDETDDEYDEDDEDAPEEDIEDEEDVMTECPKYCRCSGQYAEATTARCSKLIKEQNFSPRIAHLRIENAGEIALEARALHVRSLQQLESITIVDTKIAHLDKSAFNGTDYLFAVNLTRNALTNIDPDYFVNNTRLNLLTISGQPLGQIWSSSKNYLFNAPSVTEFDFSSNEITHLPRDAFTKMPNLDYLSLRDNRLRSIENSTIVGIDTLDELDLSQNLLTEIPATAVNEKDIQILRISSNSLTKLNLQLPSKLTALDASNNRIKVITKDDLAGGSNLEKLIVSSNGIKRIHQHSFSNLEQLNHLDISDNKLIDLTEHHLRSNARLQVVLMNDNPGLGSLPVFKTIGFEYDTYSVYRFECANCGLVSLAEGTFDAMPALATLNLARNRLTGFPARLLKSLTSLRELDLSDNLINTIEPKMFAGAITMSKLRLAGNPLVTLQVTPFLQTPGLSHLDVSRCQLRRIWSEARQPMKSLRFLSVRSNELRRITAEELKAMPKLSGLDASHNPFVCNEEFALAIGWLTEHGVTSTEVLTHLSNYENGEDYTDTDDVNQWDDFARVVCSNDNGDVSTTKTVQHKYIDDDDLPILASPKDNTLLRTDEDDESTDYYNRQAIYDNYEKMFDRKDNEYDDIHDSTDETDDGVLVMISESSDYRQSMRLRIIIGAAIVLTVVVVVLHTVRVISNRRGRGPVIRPPMILRQGLVDNKNCGLVYKPLQEEIATPHMPKRGSFYSSSTFHYDKIVPESV